MQSNQNPNPTQEMQKKFEQFVKIYQILGELLNGLPIHPGLIDKIRFEIDSGFLWVKEAMQIAIQNSQTQAQPEVKIIGVEDAPKQEEITH